MKLPNSTFKPMLRKFETMAFGITGARFKLIEIPESEKELAYTSSERKIFITRYNKIFMESLPFVETVMFLKGLFAHEVLHQLLTDFREFEHILSTMDRYEKKIFACIFNIMEDPAIEWQSKSQYGESLCKALYFMISEVYKKSTPLDSRASPLEQYLTAFIHYGDGGYVKGEFTSEEAESIFYETLPIFDEAICEKNGKRRLTLAYEVFQKTRPLWEREVEDANTRAAKFMEQLEDFMNEMGKSSTPSSGGGVTSNCGDDSDEEDIPASLKRKVLRRKLTASKKASDSDESEGDDEGSSSFENTSEDISGSTVSNSDDGEGGDDSDTPSSASSDDEGFDDSSEEIDADSSSSETDGEIDSSTKDESADNENSASSSSNTNSDDDTSSSEDTESSDSGNSGSEETEQESDQSDETDDVSAETGSDSQNDSETSDSSSSGKSDKKNDSNTNTPTHPEVPDELEGIGEIEEDEFELTDDDIADILEEIESAKTSESVEAAEKRAYNAESLDIPSVSLNYKGATCKNIRVKNSTTNGVYTYNAVVAQMRRGINVLTGQLKRIFLNDRGERKFANTGTLNIKRLQSGQMTTHVFEQRREPKNKQDICVMLLVDESGSMMGTKTKCAMKCAIGLAEVFNNLKIPVAVMGFTADTLNSDVVHYHYMHFRNTLDDRIKLLNITDRCNNFDGYSIRYATETLKKRREEHKLLIIISDGCPACRYYSYAGGISDTTQAIKEAAKVADVIGVAIDQGAVDVLRSMYKQHFVQCTKVEQLFDNLGSVIKDKIKGW